MLRRREMIGWFMLVLLLACPLALSAAGMEFQGSKTPIAHSEVQATRIDWLPQVDYERLELTVAGPGDFFVRREFAPGQTPTFSLIDPKGDRLPDGIYAYELRVVPRLSPEFREKLVKAQDAGDDSAMAELRKEGKLQERPLVQSGYLNVREGSFVDPASLQRIPVKEPAPKSSSGNITPKIVDSGACFGSNCASGETGQPLKLKDSLVRLTFEDVFDNFSHDRDWALQANDSLGGSDRFFLWDLDAGTTPFSVEGNAPDLSLYVRSNGNLGLGTSTPAVRLDVRASSSGAATERLQNSSATGYSGTEYLNNAGTVGLFFGIDNAASTTRLNSVNSNPIVILTNSTERMRVTSAGDLGIGTSSPSSKLHVNGGDIRVSGGSFIDDGVTLNAPDYVFEPSYKLMPLEALKEFVAQEKHLPNVPNAREVKEQGLNLSQFQMRLLEKIEELTLYTLSQQEQIGSLHQENSELKKRLEALEGTRQQP